MDAFRSFYEETRGRLLKEAEAYNKRLLQEPQPLIAPFFAAMADLNEGGKMLRGVLTVLGYQIACRAGEASLSQAAAQAPDPAAGDKAALAFEIFQTGVLIHDDIIDRAVTRRGKPTMTVRYEGVLEERGIEPPSSGDTRARIADGAALCAGDYLITASNLYLAEAYRSHPACASLIAAFDQIILDTIRGELLDVILPCEMADKSGEEADSLLMSSVNEIYHLKTACYSVIGPLRLGMILGGLDKARMLQVDQMADDLGIAFQIKDDILGIFADPDKLGKDVGSDIAEYKQTLLYAYVRTHAPEAMEKLAAYYGRETVTGADVAAVQEIFRDSGALAFAESEMDRRFEGALSKLKEMTWLDEEDREILDGFIEYNRGREK